jgi:hypothetical protein
MPTANSPSATRVAKRPAYGWTTFWRNQAYQPGVSGLLTALLTRPWIGAPSPNSHLPLVILAQPAGRKMDVS